MRDKPGSPDLRAAWHEARAALGSVDTPDVRGMPDGMLAHLRDTLPVETAWAPPWRGEELRQARSAAWDARLAALRATAEAHAATRHHQHDEATRHYAQPNPAREPGSARRPRAKRGRQHHPNGKTHRRARRPAPPIRPLFCRTERPDLFP